MAMSTPWCSYTRTALFQLRILVVLLVTLYCCVTVSEAGMYGCLFISLLQLLHAATRAD